MSIIELKKIAKIQNGTTPSTKIIKFWNGNIPFLGPGEIETGNTKRFISDSYGKYKRSGTILISTTATIGNIGILNKKSWFNQQITSIEANNKYIYDKYLFYFFLKEKNTIKKMKSNGSIFTILPIKIFREWKINLLSLQEQKFIIGIIERSEKLFLKYSNCVRIDNLKNVQNDMKVLIGIIEPLEIMKNNLVDQLNYFSQYSKLISNQYSVLERMNKNCIFVKGNSVSNFPEGKFLFLNVAAANGNPNKYCENEPNIFPKDVTLSLDGNTGLVNNNLLGFNGYLYKVESKTISNWQIYYSLKHQINQNIIKLNETGTTIKHSNNSKKELMLLDFKHKEILQKLFDLEINLKQQIELFDKQIKKTIDFLIK